MGNSPSTPPPSDDVTPPATQDVSETSGSKPWWKRWWGIALIVFGLFVLIGIFSDDPDEGEPVAADDAAQESSEPTSEPEPEPEPQPEPEPEPEPEPSGFGNGIHRVGTDIEVGTYRSTGTSMCYWARLSGFSGELDDIIANGNSGLEIVTIDASDAGFETSGCGDWVAAEDTYPDVPADSFEDGTFVVGEHIEPGTYQADGDQDGFCYWARLSSFGHAGVDGIIANGNSPTIIEVGESDAGFTASGCGVWTK